MSDEAAFLDALKANPADDTVRLVYADWLDEHGESAKAEYLRLVVSLVQTCARPAGELPEAGRLRSITESVSTSWRAEAGSRFRLILDGQPDVARKVETIMAIRELTGNGLAEAKGLCELTPSTLLPCVPFEYAAAGCEYLHAIPSVRAHLEPSTATGPTVTVAYQVVAHRWVYDHPVDPQILATSIDAFAIFLASALGLDSASARTRAEDRSIVLADDLEASVAFSRVLELRHLLPHSAWRDGWSLQVVAFPAGPPPAY